MGHTRARVDGATLVAAADAAGPIPVGTPAWFAWLGLHLLYVAGLRNRLSVLLNWFWGYVTWDRGPRIIFGRDRPRAATSAQDKAPLG